MLPIHLKFSSKPPMSIPHQETEKALINQGFFSIPRDQNWGKNGDVDGARTHDLRRDRAAL